MLNGKKHPQMHNPNDPIEKQLDDMLKIQEYFITEGESAIANGYAADQSLVDLARKLVKTNKLFKKRILILKNDHSLPALEAELEWINSYESNDNVKNDIFMNIWNLQITNWMLKAKTQRS